MEREQQCCARILKGILAAGLGFFALAAAPILDDGGPSGCQAGADYVAGQDAQGAAVPPAELDGSRTPVPDEVAVPLKRGRQGRSGGRGLADGADQPVGADSPADSPYVSLDGKTLAPLLNPAPCVNQPQR
jgi:hypothetical protein